MQRTAIEKKDPAQESAKKSIQIEKKESELKSAKKPDQIETKEPIAKTIPVDESKKTKKSIRGFFANGGSLGSVAGEVKTKGSASSLESSAGEAKASPNFMNMISSHPELLELLGKANPKFKDQSVAAEAIELFSKLKPMVLENGMVVPKIETKEDHENAMKFAKLVSGSGMSPNPFPTSFAKQTDTKASSHDEIKAPASGSIFEEKDQAAGWELLGKLNPKLKDAQGAQKALELFGKLKPMTLENGMVVPKIETREDYENAMKFAEFVNGNKFVMNPNPSATSEAPQTDMDGSSLAQSMINANRRLASQYDQPRPLLGGTEAVAAMAGVAGALAQNPSLSSAASGGFFGLVVGKMVEKGMFQDAITHVWNVLEIGSKVAWNKLGKPVWNNMGVGGRVGLTVGVVGAGLFGGLALVPTGVAYGLGVGTAYDGAELLAESCKLRRPGK